MHDHVLLRDTDGQVAWQRAIIPTVRLRAGGGSSGRYASSGTLGQQVVELKQMVQTLHAAGLEVILNVLCNHTAEGNYLGPTLGFRGIDHASYYRLVPDDPRYYIDYTGTGKRPCLPIHPALV